MAELGEVNSPIATIKTAILDVVGRPSPLSRRSSWGRPAGARSRTGIHRRRPGDLQKLSLFTSAFADETLMTQAFDRIRALIEQVTPTPEDGAMPFVSAVSRRRRWSFVLALICKTPGERLLPERCN